MEIGWWVEIVTHHNRFLTLEWVFDILFCILFFFSFWADHYAFKPLFLTLVSFSLFVFVCIIFLFFATHCMCTRFYSLVLAKMQSSKPDGYETYVLCSHLRFVSNYRVSGRSSWYKTVGEMLYELLWKSL